MYEEDLSSLVQDAVAGDPQAWSQLHRELSAELYRFCLRVLLSSEQAEDAASEILLKLRVKLPSVDVDRPVRPWAFRLAARHCWELLRSRRQSAPERAGAGGAPLEPQPDEQSGPTEPIVPDYVVLDEHKAAIRSALAELSDQARLIVVSRYFAELGYDEIASVVGVSTSYVGLSLLRARDQMRQLVSGDDQNNPYHHNDEGP